MDEDIQERVLAFIETRGGYVVGASERELFQLLRAYGDARAAAERERAAQIASLVFVNDPYALHPDIPFDQLNDAAQTAAHSIAQTIAGLILDQAEPGGSID